MGLKPSSSSKGEARVAEKGEYGSTTGSTGGASEMEIWGTVASVESIEMSGSGKGLGTT